MADSSHSTSSIDEWRKSVDKTLKYYKDKIKTLKSTNKARTRKLQTSWQRERRVLNNKIKSLQNKNEELQEKFDERKYVLRQEIRALRKKLKSAEEKDEEDEDEEDDDDDDSENSDVENYEIHIHKIFDYCTNIRKSIEIRSEMNMEQNDIKIVTNKHSLRLQKWMKNTKKLIEGCKEIDITQTKYSSINSSKCLLPQYNEYKQLMAEQESKMEDISNYVSDLIAQKRKIKQHIDKYETEIRDKNEMYKEAFMEYDKAKDSRKYLYDIMMESVDKLNEAIDEENELNDRKCKLYDDYNRLRFELKEYKNCLNKCLSLIVEYQKFDRVNDENINRMKIYFKNEWENFIECWYEWDSKSIIYWIQYLIAENQLVLSKNIDLNIICNEICKCKINGIWFEQIYDKNELKLIGFNILNDRQQIYDKIQQLIEKYPYYNRCNDDDDAEGQIIKRLMINNNHNKKNKNDNNNDNMQQIPKQFICPITKNIMIQPVQIFDDYTYEKNAILSYLKKYNKSPVTNEVCDDDQFMILPNRKLTQKIKTFLSRNKHLNINITPK